MRKRENVLCFCVECLSGMIGVTGRYIINDDVARFKSGMLRKSWVKVNSLILRWFGHMVKRMK